MRGATTQFLSTRGGVRLRCVVSGPIDSNHRVLLLHPLAANADFWCDVQQRLSERARCVAFDARGMGQSDAPQTTPYSFDDIVNDTIFVAEQLFGADKRFALVGCSMGGFVGQLIAIQRPEKLAQLILVSTTSVVPAAAGPMWDDRIKTVREKGMIALADGTMQRWFSKAALASNDDACMALIQRIREQFLATPPIGYIGHGGAISKFDVSQDLHKISTPTLIVAGEEDQSTTPEHMGAIHKGVAGSKLVVFKGSHALPAEFPKEFVELVLPFIESTEGKL